MFEMILGISHKEVALFIILFIASIKDMQERIIPDWMPFLIMIISMMPVGLPHPAGILACVPLLLAAMMVGGVGGGDIKIVAAVGTVVGFGRTIAGLTIALVIMMLFHLVNCIVRAVVMHIMNHKMSNKECRDKKDIPALRNCESYPMVPFIFIGMLIAVYMFG